MTTIKDWMGEHQVTVTFAPLYVDYGDSDKYIEHPSFKYTATVQMGDKKASFDYSGGIMAFLSDEARKKLAQQARMSFGIDEQIYKGLTSGKKFYNTPEVKKVIEAMFRYSKPQGEDLLNCLVLDAATESSFEDWTADFGYDTDSRKAFDTYQACLKERSKLIGLLGRQLFDSLTQCEQL